MRFSIVITCYNQADFIRDAVQSAISQRFADREIIVVDDGSTDGSVDILTTYGCSIRFIQLPRNGGAIAARNYGAAAASGEYIVFLDGDDALMPWALDVYARMIAERAPILILAKHTSVERSIPPITPQCEPTAINAVTYDVPMSKDRPASLSASAFVVHATTFKNAGCWTPGIFHLDLQDLVTKLGYAGPMTLICSPATVFYRIHSRNSIHSVPPFIASLYRLVEKETTGQYPGGSQHRFERRAWLGGLSFFWVKRALRAGLYRDAMKLAARSSPWIAAGAVRRAVTWLAGRRPVETITIDV